MRDQPRWFSAALVPLILGVLWLTIGWQAGFVAGALASVPGSVLAAAGGALLLWPGDRQISHYMALAAVVSLPLALLLAPVLGLMAALLLAIGAIGAFLTAGLAAMYQDPVPWEVPLPPMTLKLARKVATDEALLGWFVNSARIPRGRAVADDADTLAALERLAGEQDWHTDPQQLHAAPGTPQDTRLQSARAGKRRFEWLSFDSGYTPVQPLPGRARWQHYVANQRMHARVLRHPGAPRPWLMCIHGYRMGSDVLDLSLFDVNRLHDGLGFNLIMPILPLHGRRRAGRLSGALYLDGPMANLLHAQTQAVWDLRRCLAWVRSHQAGMRVGLMGYSLGGYNAALIAALEPDLDCVIAGVPLADIPSALWRHMPSVHLRFVEAQGIDADRIRHVLAPVSPLHLRPRIALDRRYIFAATADQIVPPDQALRLWHHWERPTMHWYHGSHLSVRNEPALGPLVASALRDTGLVGAVDAAQA